MNTFDASRRKLLEATKRVEVPEDLVGALSFLTSDDTAFMAGQTLTAGGCGRSPLHNAQNQTLV
jgi:hypothetical protein